MQYLPTNQNNGGYEPYEDETGDPRLKKLFQLQQPMSQYQPEQVPPANFPGVSFAPPAMINPRGRSFTDDGETGGIKPPPGGEPVFKPSGDPMLDGSSYGSGLDQMTGGIKPPGQSLGGMIKGGFKDAVSPFRGAVKGLLGGIKSMGA